MVVRLRNLVTQYRLVLEYPHYFQKVAEIRDLVTLFRPEASFYASTQGVLSATAEPAGRFRDLGSGLYFLAYSASYVGLRSYLPFGIEVLNKTFAALHYEDQEEKRYGSSYTCTF